MFTYLPAVTTFNSPDGQNFAYLIATVFWLALEGQTVKFVLCAGNTQSLNFSCADAAYVDMQSMESTLVLPNPFQAVKGG